MPEAVASARVRETASATRTNIRITWLIKDILRLHVEDVVGGELYDFAICIHVFGALRGSDGRRADVSVLHLG